MDYRLISAAVGEDPGEGGGEDADVLPLMMARNPNISQEELNERMDVRHNANSAR